MLWQKSRKRDGIEYKNVCKIVKSAVSIAKLNRYDGLYKRLGTLKKEKKCIYWLRLEKNNPGTFKMFGA
jgi:hypothetical protein